MSVFKIVTIVFVCKHSVLLFWLFNLQVHILQYWDAEGNLACKKKGKVFSYIVRSLTTAEITYLDMLQWKGIIYNSWWFTKDPKTKVVSQVRVVASTIDLSRAKAYHSNQVNTENIHGYTKQLSLNSIIYYLYRCWYS